MQRIAIQLANGYKLVAEQNVDESYSKEIFVGITNGEGSWLQDLAIIRPSYEIEDLKVQWKEDQFDVLVFGNEYEEDFTEEYHIGLHKEGENE